jgi:hypothetical protein
MKIEAEQISSELSSTVDCFSISSTRMEGREDGLHRAVGVPRKREEIMLTCHKF